MASVDGSKATRRHLRLATFAPNIITNICHDRRHSLEATRDNNTPRYLITFVDTVQLACSSHNTAQYNTSQRLPSRRLTAKRHQNGCNVGRRRWSARPTASGTVVL
jgi:hypothetical protein